MALFLVTETLNAYEVKGVEPHEESLFYENLLSHMAREGAQRTGLIPVTPLYLKILNEKKECIAGMAGYEFYGSLLIDILWVHPDHRKKGIGTLLLQKAEDLALKKNLKFITVSTIEFWEARDFYKKMGFKIEFVREGFEKGFKQYHLIKHLDVSEQ